MATGNVHTTYDRERGRWKNKREGAQRASGYYDTAAAASVAGQGLARSTGDEWLKHRKDNARIHERNTYGDDPFPPRG